MSDLVKVTAELAELEDRLENLRRQKLILEREEQSQSPEHKLAIALHDSMCTHNHTDGCGWFYEVSTGVHNWNGNEHGVWLMKARKISTFCTKHQVPIKAATELMRFIQEV